MEISTKKSKRIAKIDENFVLKFKGDYVAIEEKPVDNKKGRLIREEAEDDGSEDERVDMSDITGAKEIEERREKFYSVQGHGKFP